MKENWYFWQCIKESCISKHKKTRTKMFFYILWISLQNPSWSEIWASQIKSFNTDPVKQNSQKNSLLKITILSSFIYPRVILITVVVLNKEREDLNNQGEWTMTGFSFSCFICSYSIFEKLSTFKVCTWQNKSVSCSMRFSVLVS